MIFWVLLVIEYCSCKSVLKGLQSFKLMIYDYYRKNNKWFHLTQTYFGYDVESGGDEIGREARKAMIKTYGQTPQQLFSHPHPPVSNAGFAQNPQVCN